MSTARWSLRLPRAGSPLALRRMARSGVRRVEQRRWVQKPPPRHRPWAGRPDEDGERHNEEFTRRMQAQHEKQQAEAQAQEPQGGRNTQLAQTLAESDTSDLLAEVRIPDDPDGVLAMDHPAMSILGNSSLVIQRQIEMMNLMLGFEQANRYIIMNGQGQTIGYIAERDHGIGSAMTRQLFRTHRSFTTYIFDAQEREVLRIHRPFAYINSRIRIYDPVPAGGYQSTETSTALQGASASSVIQQGAVAQISPLKLEEMRIIGEAQQQWAPLRRKYNLFSYRPLTPPPSQAEQARIESGDKPKSDTTAITEAKVPDRAIEAGMAQFAHVSEPFLSWDFNLRAEDQSLIGSVNRNFAGFAREIFTDTGVYALRMDSAAQSSVLESTEGKPLAAYERDATAMSLDQRAVMLATAVSIDFDYFSRHSGAGHGGFMPIFWPMGGGTAAEGAGAGAAGGAAAGGVAGAAGEAGAIEGAAGAAGAAGRGLSGAAGGVSESGIAAAGTMAGYEAMQRGVYGNRGAGDPANEPVFDPDRDNRQSSGPGEPLDSPFGAQGGGNKPPTAEQQQQESEGNWWDDDPPPPPSAGGDVGGGGGGEGGGGWADAISDFFSD